jgi:molybdopterin-containing oxidoreductase family membrane subunit
MPSLIGVFDEPEPVAEAARRLRNRGYRKLEIYAPAAFSELEFALDERPSGVRAWTLIGGLLGVTTGYALTIWMSLDWPIVVGGKPFASVAPYTIIGFELTILFGGLATLLGLLVVGRLPYGRFGRPDKAYGARFSAEDFGLYVECAERDVAEVDALLRAHHAQEVTLVEA